MRSVSRNRTKMPSNAPTECGICNETFTDEEHCPRILPCSHCFCSRCIDQLIEKNAKICPFCRRNFEAESAQDLLINRSLLEILEYVAELESTDKQPGHGGGKVNQLAKMMTEFEEQNKKASEENLSECQRTADLINKAIRNNTNLRDGLVKTNKIIEEDILTKLQEIKLKNGRQIKYFGEENGRLMSHLEGISAREKEIKDINADLKASSDFAAAAPTMGKADQTNKSIKEYLKDLKELLNMDQKTLLGIGKAARKIVGKITVVQEALTVSGEEEESDIDLTHGMAALAMQNEIPEDVTVDDLRKKSYPVRILTRQGRILAVQDLKGHRRYARITITEEDQLCLHHLEDKEPLLTNVRLIKFDDVMSLVDISCRRTFLELGVRRRSLGSLLIRHSNDRHDKYVLNYILLCTGEMGHSYANSNLLAVWNKDDQTYERVWLGDYENSDGKGGKALEEGGVDWTKEWEKGIYKRPWEKGTVTGYYCSEAKASQFVIYTRDNPGDSLSGSFGKVEEGLNVLTEAISQHPEMKKLKILDCGILLSN